MSPPPLFKQGTSARVKGIFFSLIAIMLLVVDARMHMLHWVRQAANSVLYPVEMLVLAPRDVANDIGTYFERLSVLETENAELKRTQLAQALEIQQGRQLSSENLQLRQLLGASQKLAVKSLMAAILYDARDSFTRRVIVNRGHHHNVTLGQPVIDEKGVIGQVTRIFPLTAEVTLLTDKDQAIPVQIQRNGLRSVLYGKGQSGNLEMRVPSNADLKVGDILVTSGIDGTYPTGLLVARVSLIDHNAASTFDRIVCVPLAGIDRHKEVLILLIDTPIAARPSDENPKPPKVNRRITRDTSEPKKDPPEQVNKAQL